MQWSSDRCGYPVLELPSARLAVHLLPVVKQQFERFLAEPGSFGDGWYEEILTISPRVPLSESSPDPFELLLLGGIQPNEVAPFANWFGSGFDLPTAEEWRLVDEDLAAIQVTETEIQLLQADSALHPTARRILGWLIESHRPQTWGELALFRGGLLEWVRTGPAQYGALGVPRPEFQAMIVNPQRDSPVRPVDPSKRYRFFGFRLFKPLAV
jgi:hypothetical protein